MLATRKARVAFVLCILAERETQIDMEMAASKDVCRLDQRHPPHHRPSKQVVCGWIRHLKSAGLAALIQKMPRRLFRLVRPWR